MEQSRKGRRQRLFRFPLLPGGGDEEYLTLFERILKPIALEFNPDLVLVGAGFDIHVYIFVHPAIGRQEVGSYLLGSLMAAVRDTGCNRMLSGMYAEWETSIRLHRQMGFRIRRRLSQCRWLNIFPVPPKEAPSG